MVTTRLCPFVLAGCAVGLALARTGPLPSGSQAGVCLQLMAQLCTLRPAVCARSSCPIRLRFSFPGLCSPDALEDGASPRAGPVPDASLDPRTGPGGSKPEVLSG